MIRNGRWPKQDLWNLLPAIIVLLLGAAYFAIMETAFASASRIRLKAAADHGNRRAQQAMYVLDHFDQAITTLLIGTNILHLTIATLVTVAVQRQWGMWSSPPARSSRPWSCSSPGRCCPRASPRNTPSGWPCARRARCGFSWCSLSPCPPPSPPSATPPPAASRASPP